MKIIIVGAGPAGLATYLSLRKYAPDAEVVVYERHSPLPNVDHMSHGHNHQNESDGPAQATSGGGVGVAANGMRALYSLSPKIYSQVIRDGWETMFMEMRTSSGWRLGYFPQHSSAPEHNIEHSVKVGDRSDGFKGKLGTVMISREALWRVLYAAVRQEERTRLVKIVHEGVKIVKVDAAEGIIEFADGKTERADLIIGADGLHSRCRESVIDPGEAGREAKFEGLMGIGGFMPTVPKNCDEAKHNCEEKKRKMCKKNPSAVLVFGAKGFVGYSPCTMCVSNSTKGPATRGPGPTSFWWATYTAPEAISDMTEDSKGAGVSEIQHRMKSYTEHRVQRILADLKLDRTSLPRKESSESSDDSPKPLSRRRTSIKWRDDPSVPSNAGVTITTPAWSLPPTARWHRRRVLLIGDAAHALPSTSGQGISQALEDAITIGVLLSKQLSQDSTLSEKPVSTDSDSLEKLGQIYERFRRPRVEKILQQALQMQNNKKDASSVHMACVYVVMWLMLRFRAGSVEEWKLGFDVESEVSKVDLLTF